MARWLECEAKCWHSVLGSIVLLVLVTSLCSRGGLTVSDGATPTAELRARLLPNETKTGFRRAVAFEIRNIGQSPFAIPKPMFPTRWLVVRHYSEGSLPLTEERPGGRGPGLPAIGYEDTYPEREYVTVKPGRSFETTEDLDWYLAFPGSTVLRGRYVVKFFYDYEPSKGESRLGILSEKLESNAIEIQIKLPGRSQP